MSASLPTRSPQQAELASVHERMKAVAGIARLPLRAGAFSGVTGSVLGQGTGSSIDFQDQRPYLPGDDPRHINWQAYARSGHYTMKLYRQEVTPRVDFLFDASGSMFLNETKARRSWELAYFCMESALRLGASLRIYDLSKTPSEMPIERILAHDWPLGDQPHKPSLGAALERIPFRTGSLRVLVSDLLCEEAPDHLVPLLLSGRGRGIVLAPFSAEEAHPDWSGNIQFEDCESRTLERRRVLADVLARYLRAYDTHFSLWREQCARRGAAFAKVSAEGEFLVCLRSEAVSAGAIEI